ncbi:MAG: hypothetical protein RLZZ59_778 [Pseudomonadota bacterium]|jgi:ATP-dependent Clp protease ATP-binding subunit ClpA
MMFSQVLEKILHNTLLVAKTYKHEYATFEHLLLALLKDSEVIDSLKKNKVDVESLKNALDNYIKFELSSLVNEYIKAAKPTAGLQRVLHRAAIYGHAVGHEEVGAIHVLAELFLEPESYAVQILKENNVTRRDVVSYAMQNAYDEYDSVSKSSLEESLPENNISIASAKPLDVEGLFNMLEAKPERSENSNSGDSILRSHCTNLNELASNGCIDNLVGRDSEIQRTIEILCRRQKNNAILVGEPGVGKTAIAEGLALRIVQGDVPDMLKKTTIYSLDLGSLVSGTRYRGDFEDRIKKILAELKADPHSVLFIDEIHSIIGAGATATGSLDASNLLKPALARGDLRCIGATTFQEFHKNFEKDPALVRRFQKVMVQEPTDEQSVEILKGLKAHYEEHHDCRYEDAAIVAAVNLSQRYITDRHLPDKAIDLIDEAGSRKKLIGGGSRTVTVHDIEMIVSDVSHIPSIVIATDEATKLKKLETNLKGVIFGQDEAVENLCSSVKLAKAGLRRVDRPIGCYLFAGPTGVGKTELAKQLAHFSGMALVRFDMSEYAESHSVSRLIGTPPGYVGFDQGGLLTEEVSKHPYSVVLLDEIEKANPEIFNLLLQVMDHGELTDSTGKTVNFAHTILIMTTNAGASAMVRQSMGFAKSDNEGSREAKSVLDGLFSPEFRSRLDEIILFNPITKSEIIKIVDKNLNEFTAQLADKKVSIKYTQSVKDNLVEQCLDSPKGARVLDRIIDTDLKKSIADALLFGDLKNGGDVDVTYSEGEIKFKFSKKRIPTGEIV